MMESLRNKRESKKTKSKKESVKLNGSCSCSCSWVVEFQAKDVAD